MKQEKKPTVKYGQPFLCSLNICYNLPSLSLIALMIHDIRNGFLSTSLFSLSLHIVLPCGGVSTTHRFLLEFLHRYCHILNPLTAHAHNNHAVPAAVAALHTLKGAVNGAANVAAIAAGAPPPNATPPAISHHVTAA